MAANHGSSPAAWTTVTIIVVGFTVGGLALVLGSTAGVVVGGGVVVAAFVAGKVMQLVGLGQHTYPAVSRLSGRGAKDTGHAEPEGAG